MTEFKENEDINRNTEQKIVDTIPNSCSIFASSLVINWNGVCNPCCHDYNGSVVLGDANKQSIKEIFSSLESNNFYNQILTDRSKNKICSTCPIDRRTTNKRNINYY
jgi:radical SAM protein with 4Fe4S-binding SPASM domain